MTYAQRAVVAVLGTHDDARMLTMIRSSWRCGEEFGPEFRALVDALPYIRPAPMRAAQTP